MRRRHPSSHTHLRRGASPLPAPSPSFHLLQPVHMLSASLLLVRSPPMRSHSAPSPPRAPPCPTQSYPHPHAEPAILTLSKSMMSCRRTVTFCRRCSALPPPSALTLLHARGALVIPKVRIIHLRPTSTGSKMRPRLLSLSYTALQLIARGHCVDARAK
jgi:hypothetical protein